MFGESIQTDCEVPRRLPRLGMTGSSDALPSSERLEVFEQVSLFLDAEGRAVVVAGIGVAAS
jgi:hypothetical protein